MEMERDEFIRTLSAHPVPYGYYKSFGDYLNSVTYDFACESALHIADLLTHEIDTEEAPFFVEVVRDHELVCYDPEDTAYHIGTLRRVEVCDYNVDIDQIDYYPQYYYICNLDEDIVNC